MSDIKDPTDALLKICNDFINFTYDEESLEGRPIVDENDEYIGYAPVSFMRDKFIEIMRKHGMYYHETISTPDEEKP